MAASARSRGVGLGEDARLAVRHHLLDARGPHRHRGQPAGVGLGEHEALGLGLGGEEEQIGGLVVSGQRARAPGRRAKTDPRRGRARRRAAARAPRLWLPCPTSMQLGVGQRGGDRREGVEHALHALLAIEPAGVEADRARRRAGPDDGRARSRLSRDGRARGPPRWGSPRRARRTPRARRVSAMRARRARRRGRRESAKRQASRTARAAHQPPRQRHVVRVLLVARVIREDERAPQPPGEAPPGHAEQERMLGVDDVEAERPGRRGRGAARRAAAARSPDRSARESTGSGRRRAGRRAARAAAGRRSRSGARAPRAPAAGSRPRS